MTTVSSQAQGANKVRAQNNFGIGIGAGTLATGVSMKYFLDQPLALQGNVGWWRSRYYCTRTHCYGGGDSLALSADLLWEQPAFAGNQDVKVAWAIGGSVGLGLDDVFDDVGVAVALVLGLEVNIDLVPIDVVVEYRPGLYFLPGFAFDPINFTGHIRYFF